MNWMLTIVFLYVMFWIYNLLGKSIMEVAGYKKISLSKSVILGYLSMFLIAFFIGFPIQYFHLSWDLFFYLLTAAYLIVLAIIIKRKTKEIITAFKKIRTDWKIILKDHFKEYWFLYALVIGFSLLSMANQLAYYRQNYDDGYYIGKIVKAVQSNALSMENFHNGSLDMAHATNIRLLLSTGEITQAYFATVFNIYIPFFARATLVIHNYFLIFFIYQALAKEFIDRYRAQFALLFFPVLLIASGYLMATVGIRIYDGWQFQNAVFYTSSIRYIIIPVLILFGKDLFVKISWKKLLVIIGACISAISFSTIAFQPIIIAGLSFCIIWPLTKIKKNATSNQNIKFAILSLFVIGMLIMTKKTFSILPFLSTEQYWSNAADYAAFYHGDVLNDRILKIGLFIIATGMLVFKNKKFIYSSAIILIFYIIFYSNLFNIFTNLTAVNYYFVSLRTIASLQVMLLFMAGLIVTKLFCLLPKNYLISSVVSVIIIIGFGTYVIVKEEKIIQQNFIGSGVNEEGYSLERLLNNDTMVHPIIKQVGDYFNTLEYRNYRVLFYAKYNCEGGAVNSVGFVMGSNRIEICQHEGCNGTTEKELGQMYLYLDNQIKFEEVSGILEKRGIEYTLVYNEDVLRDLTNRGYKVAKTISMEKNQSFYLVRLK